MPIEFRIKRATLLAALAAAYPCVSHGAAASIDFVVGDVKALLPDGRSRALAKGAEVNSGEMIDTGNGRAQVRFSDGAQVSLQPQTQFRIDNYQFKGKPDGSEKGFFSLLKGGMRTITGLIGRGNRDNYKVSTTVATIGIRGTEYSVTYGNSITVSTGEGSIELCNAGGCMTLNSGETGYVANNNTLPVRTDSKASLPPTQPGDVGGILPPALPLQLATAVLLSGPGYQIAYSHSNAAPTLGANVSMKGDFDATGQMTQFGNGSFTQNVGSNAISDSGTDGVLAWGRWTGGTTVATGSASAATFGANQGFHYVIGQPTAAMPTSGVASMSLVGATKPTINDGSLAPGSFAGALKVDFGAYKVGADFTVSIGALSIPIVTAGGLATPSSSELSISGASFNGTVTSTGGTCGACTCTANVTGLFSGTGATSAGMAYKILDNTTSKYIQGTAAFKQ
jgi:hypothetical protein